MGSRIADGCPLTSILQCFWKWPYINTLSQQCSKVCTRNMSPDVADTFEFQISTSFCPYTRMTQCSGQSHLCWNLGAMPDKTLYHWHNCPEHRIVHVWGPKEMWCSRTKCTSHRREGLSWMLDLAIGLEFPWPWFNTKFPAVKMKRECWAFFASWNISLSHCKRKAVCFHSSFPGGRIL